MDLCIFDLSMLDFVYNRNLLYIQGGIMVALPCIPKRKNTLPVDLFPCTDYMGHKEMDYTAQ